MKLSRLLTPALVVVLLCGSLLSPRAFGRSRGHLVILMVWDGLRPDSVNARDTPALDALAREGVRFAHHHSVFPTLTMVNAAALATGAAPAANGIVGNSMYFKAGTAPTDLEHTKVLAALDKSMGGKLVASSTVVQDLLRAGGYAAIVGKQGPTFLFDDQALDSSDHRHLLFVPGDDPRVPAMGDSDFASEAARDAWFTETVINEALPAAKESIDEGRPALIVLWQRNPDYTQHRAGLGTQPALDILHRCDENLAKLREAVSKTGLARHTDIVVVSDHGFATIKMMVGLSDLLVTAGLKQSRDSTEMVIARNAGSDFVHLAPDRFGTDEARRAMLARIVDFAAAQDWSGPIFSKPGPPPGSSGRDDNLGWIPGTFSEKLIGIYNPDRSPDLVVSFREISDVDNSGVTGPGKPSFALGSHGQALAPNHSAPLVRPMPGLVYADSASDFFTTGLGIHGAAGARELHNFCSAIGPDFKRHFEDPDPSGNLDIAPTLRAILGVHSSDEANGRNLHEALSAATQPENSKISDSTATAYLVIQGAQIVSKLDLTSFAGETYLDGSNVSHLTIGPPQ